MKIYIKIALLYLLIFMFIFITGCRKLTQYREPEQQYLVSAIGFDRNEDKLKVSLEVIIFSVGEAESSIESKVFTGVGQTVKQAIGSLSGEVAKKLKYDHCALLVLGESISAEQTDEIFIFCSSGKDIPISTSLVSAPDAEALLKCDSISTPVTGYDITGVIKQKSDDWGIGLRNRLYEIEGQRKSGSNYFAIPYFIVNDNENEKVYSFSGIRLYENDLPSLLFDLPASVLYSLLTNTYGSGTFYLESDGEIYQPEVKSAKSSVTGDDSCGRLCITVKMHLVLRREQIDKVDSSALSTVLEKKARDFFITAQASTHSDIFELASRLGKTAGFTSGNRPEYSEVDISFKITSPDKS